MTVLDINEIKKILPHRYPLLLVDRILEIEPMKRAVGLKNITANEVFPTNLLCRAYFLLKLWLKLVALQCFTLKKIVVKLLCS